MEFLSLESNFGVTDSGVPSLGGMRGSRMPQGPKFDGCDTKFPSWVEVFRYMQNNADC